MSGAELAAPVRLFLCGDVMPGRGIDQILPQPSQPQLFEPYVADARDYLALAEMASGPIPRRVAPAYIWGDALAELERHRPDLRLINLETSVTTSNAAWPDKGINYRMHPANLSVLQAARPDCCSLANNHVLDWGYAGLSETLKCLHAGGIQTVGAGADGDAARRPASFPLPGGQRLLVFACGDCSSGIPPAWAAGPDQPGVALLPDLSAASAEALAQHIEAQRRPGDRVLLSIHWGSNWGYRIPSAQRRFAHALVDRGAVDLIHGHSSHHPRPIEVYRERLILYGCGDLINDYEGIGGYENYRSELTALYFAELSADGALLGLRLCPLRLRRFRLERAAPADAAWLARALNAPEVRFGAELTVAADSTLALRW